MIVVDMSGAHERAAVMKLTRTSMQAIRLLNEWWHS
jgi:hypothetical protein